MSRNRLCKQVSIESPSRIGQKEHVFQYDVMVPEVPPQGARIKVMCAGACYRSRSTSVSSTCSNSSYGSESGMSAGSSQSLIGFRDSSFYPGYEVAGVVESIGEEVDPNCQVKVGDNVIVYPFDEVPPGYAEYMSVPEIQFLVKIPDNMSLSVASMLPSGALAALNTVRKAEVAVQNILEKKGPDGMCHFLVVGTGGLALWALRLARYFFGDKQNRVHIAVACLRDEGFSLAKECGKVDVIQWSEDLYERILIDRTIDACKGQVDVVIDFGTTSRSLNRSLQCLNKGGVVFIGHETADRLMPKFARKADDLAVSIQSVELGSIEQLNELVQLVSSGQVQPPPYSVFPAEEAPEVISKLCKSQIPGRAVLQFHSATQ